MHKATYNKLWMKKKMTDNELCSLIEFFELLAKIDQQDESDDT